MHKDGKLSFHREPPITEPFLLHSPINLRTTRVTFASHSHHAFTPAASTRRSRPAWRQRTPPQKTRRSLSWKNPTTKAEIVAAIMRIIVDAERRAQAQPMMVPTAPAQHPVIPARGTGWVTPSGAAVIIRIIPVVHPLPGVARHVQCTIWAGT